MLNSSIVSPLAVANYFVGKSLQSGVELTPMKLIKMVYIAHGWHLGVYDTPLINEAVQAWKYGPVIDSVYQHFKKYRDKQVTAMAESSVDGQISIPTVGDNSALITFLDVIWEKYKKFNGWELSDITHQQDTPWDKTWKQNGGGSMSGAIIPNNEIAEHYRQLKKQRH